jgi:hypothetical protein
MTIIRIGLNTAKLVFQVHGVDENEETVLRRQRVAALVDNRKSCPFSTEAV